MKTNIYRVSVETDGDAQTKTVSATNFLNALEQVLPTVDANADVLEIFAERVQETLPVTIMYEDGTSRLYQQPIVGETL